MFFRDQYKDALVTKSGQEGWGLGFRVRDLGLRSEDLGVETRGISSRVQDLRFLNYWWLKGHCGSKGMERHWNLLLLPGLW